ncbi:TraR/DksA C4-type zinc finger protein [Paenibacillus sp. YN15]|uniref:TraR/DksA C4-type zinc finger protein n=1 Tax=Paenibacillus sp. YN15 TaxID=1742774 RepID=UPI000DCB23B0|nr:TraR/DksA C4-type zinc finger protein [Paenibacillus sp. YN15]RAV04715.1 molecular chaperone DnaK [Paenibacillus sp. YN15]
MNHLSATQLDTLRRQLLRDKQELTNQLRESDQFGLRDSLREGVGELSAYDNHPADLGSEVFERGKDLALAEQTQHHLADVERALADMDAGIYGICKASGEPIPFERLAAMPTAEFTVDHTPPKPHFNRPIEEEFLQPPFGRTSLDERADETEFDGEDAWQIVESWGTSNTPAMAESPQVESYEEMEIEADEQVGYVEPIESFLATDIYGRHVTVVRNKQYREYMDNGEGEGLLEEDTAAQDEL